MSKNNNKPRNVENVMIGEETQQTPDLTQGNEGEVNEENKDLENQTNEGLDNQEENKEGEKKDEEKKEEDKKDEEEENEKEEEKSEVRQAFVTDVLLRNRYNAAMEEVEDIIENKMEQFKKAKKWKFTFVGIGGSIRFVNKGKFVIADLSNPDVEISNDAKLAEMLLKSKKFKVVSYK